MAYATQCIQPGFIYFQEKFKGELGNVVDAFKAARLFSPSKAHEMQPTAEKIDDLTVFPFVQQAVLPHLKTELPMAADMDPLE